MSMGDPNNIKMGTCKITYGGVDLGLTMGGVEVTVETTTHESKVDQFGDTIVNEFIMGRSITAVVPLAETTVEMLATIMPGATKTGTGATLRVDVSTGTGISLRETAKPLILHPINKADSDKSEDLTIPLAATPGGINFAYKYDEERIYQADFKGYPDLDSGLLFSYGAPAAQKQADK